jgi:hypothetical protein
MYSLTIKSRILRVFLDGRTVLSIVLSMFALLLCVGLSLSSLTNSPNYMYVAQLLGYYTWAALFGTYGIIKLVNCIYRIPCFIRVLNSNLGLWAWTYIYLSFTVFDTTTINPLEHILLLPILCEVWALTLILYNPIHRRATDVCQR